MGTFANMEIYQQCRRGNPMRKFAEAKKKKATLVLLLPLFTLLSLSCPRYITLPCFKESIKLFSVNLVSTISSLKGKMGDRNKTRKVMRLCGWEWAVGGKGVKGRSWWIAIMRRKYSQQLQRTVSSLVTLIHASLQNTLCTVEKITWNFLSFSCSVFPQQLPVWLDLYHICISTRL